MTCSITSQSPRLHASSPAAVAALLGALGLSACGTAPLPECDDPSIVETVHTIMTQELERAFAGYPQAAGSPANLMDLKVSDPRTSRRLQSGEMVYCTATARSSIRVAGGPESDDKSGALPLPPISISYVLSYTDRDEVWVEVTEM